MKDISLVQLDDVLSRLDEREQNVSLIDSASGDGWTPTLAWNPVDSLRLMGGNFIHAVEQIEAFTKAQQKQGRLVIGYMSYDLGSRLRGVAPHTSDDLQTPLALLYSFDDWLTFEGDALDIHDGSGVFQKSIEAIMRRQSRDVPSRLYTDPLSPTLTREQYASAYQKVKSYITAGDVYQVNLTHRLQGTTNVSGLDIYRRTASDSRTNYRAYIASADCDVISMSPERFVSIADNVIQTTPIKGTRPRGKTSDEDELLRADLLTNEKDMAELNMITDLMRNDLGEVCEVGSVKVIDERVLTAYPTLWHAHSTIRGTLAESVSSIRALMTLLPGGSITGCPKKRAIEIIDELEATRRGIYTGSIFVIQPDGALDSNIAIRTMIKQDNSIYLSVGGGIVYDSNEQDEYDETLQKAAVFVSTD